MASFLVIGGAGFIGSAIVRELIHAGQSPVAVMDVVEPHDLAVQFHRGDLSEPEDIDRVLTNVKPTCVFHCASPARHAKKAVLNAVNVEGTRALVKAAADHGVQRLVYTSTAALAWNGLYEVIDVDERCPPAENLDPLDGSKAQAEEIVIKAHSPTGLRTTVIRPSFVYGPGDPGIVALEALAKLSTSYQPMDNEKFFDSVFIGDVARAHVLAADLLSASQRSQPDTMSADLPPVNLTLTFRRNPTSRSVSGGSDDLEFRFVNRNKFDQLLPSVMEKEDASPLQVGGQAFFITGGEPICWLDFVQALARELRIGYPDEVPWRVPGAIVEQVRRIHRLVAPRSIYYKSPLVQYSQTSFTFNIEKARRVLRYEPKTGVEEGIRKTVEWWNSKGRVL